MPEGHDLKYGVVKTEHKEFHEGEPVFIIRAQDPLAVEAIDAYGEICSKAGVNSDHLAAVAKAAGEFQDWQEDNSSLVKEEPDS